MLGRVLNNTNFYFDKSYSPQLLVLSLKVWIWSKIPVLFLITTSTHSTAKLERIEIFKTGFRKLSILSKIRERRIWQGVRGSSCLPTKIDSPFIHDYYILNGHTSLIYQLLSSWIKFCHMNFIWIHFHCL